MGLQELASSQRVARENVEQTGLGRVRGIHGAVDSQDGVTNHDSSFVLTDEVDLDC